MSEMTDASTLVFVCLEAGCERRFEADAEEQLVSEVNAHMSEAHNTFELEDVILTNANRT